MPTFFSPPRHLTASAPARFFPHDLPRPRSPNCLFLCLHICPADCSTFTIGQPGVYCLNLSGICRRRRMQVSCTHSNDYSLVSPNCLFLCLRICPADCSTFTTWAAGRLLPQSESHTL